jgi:hypothetical protein
MVPRADRRYISASTNLIEFFTKAEKWLKEEEVRIDSSLITLFSYVLTETHRLKHSCTLSIRPSRTPATTIAHAPVPQASVAPATFKSKHLDK